MLYHMCVVSHLIVTSFSLPPSILPSIYITIASGALTSLNVSMNALCGIDEWGEGTYDASGLTALVDAIGKHQ